MRERANLFKYLRCKQIVDQECTPERSENDCEVCPFAIECDYFVNHDLPWLVNFYYEIDFKIYDIKEKIANWMAKYKKAYYVCEVCGKIEAPYFDEKPCSITYGYGWHQFKYSPRWICHHCADHEFALESEKDIPEEDRDFTWEEWQKFVKEENIKLLDSIKEKDPEFYRKSGMGWIRR